VGVNTKRAAEPVGVGSAKGDLVASQG